MNPRQCGFSLLELSVVAVLWVVLFGVFLERLTYYQEAAERARFESELQIVKTGLQLRMAELISTNREALVRQLEAENPLRWLSEKLADYAGEYPVRPDPGAWYFDSANRELVYVVNQNRFLSVESQVKPKQLRFRVRVNYQPVDASGGRVRGLSGVTLEPVYLFRWL
jgi:type II secretory pathway pseudopilin PulG